MWTLHSRKIMGLGFVLVLLSETTAVGDVSSGVRVCQERAQDYGCFEVPVADHIQGGSPGMLTAGCSSNLEGSKPANHGTLG